MLDGLWTARSSHLLAPVEQFTYSPFLCLSNDHDRFHRQKHSNGSCYRTDIHKPLQICLRQVREEGKRGCKQTSWREPFLFIWFSLMLFLFVNTSYCHIDALRLEWTSASFSYLLRRCRMRVGEYISLFTTEGASLILSMFIVQLKPWTMEITFSRSDVKKDEGNSWNYIMVQVLQGWIKFSQ